VQVVEGSPAATAGLRTEDLILEIDGVAVNGMDDLQRLMDAEAIGRQVAVRVHRGGRASVLQVTPIELQG
jgi:S1-C subfamily serine protease